MNWLRAIGFTLVATMIATASLAQTDSSNRAGEVGSKTLPLNGPLTYDGGGGVVARVRPTCNPGEALVLDATSGSPMCIKADALHPAELK